MVGPRALDSNPAFALTCDGSPDKLSSLTSHVPHSQRGNGNDSNSNPQMWGPFEDKMRFCIYYLAWSIRKTQETIAALFSFSLELPMNVFYDDLII